MGRARRVVGLTFRFYPHVPRGFLKEIGDMRRSMSTQNRDLKRWGVVQFETHIDDYRLTDSRYCHDWVSGGDYIREFSVAGKATHGPIAI